MVRHGRVRQDDLVNREASQTGTPRDSKDRDASKGSWLDRRRLRYKIHPTVPFEDVRSALKTGDIILFHKTTRNGLLDILELDILAPLFFDQNEFRHSGIIVRRGDDLFVMECTEERHSGYAHAVYPTGGKGIREVPLLPLLEEYTRDNGEAHFGIRAIASEIPLESLVEIVREVGPVGYMKGHRSVTIFLSQYVLPGPVLRKVVDRNAHLMMCSEFVHRVLSRHGALRNFPSKLFAPYIIENPALFSSHEVVPFSEIVRFTYPERRQLR